MGRHMTRKKGTTEQGISDIMSTQIYQNCDEFTASDMLDKLQKMGDAVNRITCKQRVSQLLVQMQYDGLVDRVAQNGILRFRKPGSKMLRQRWVSEAAEDLCAGNYVGNLSGKTSLDVRESPRSLAGSC